MHPHLKGISVPPAGFIEHPISSELKNLKGFHSLQTYYPGLGSLCNIRKQPSEDIWFNHSYRLRSILKSGESSLKSSGRVNIRIELNKKESGVQVQDISGFRKITHLLDPVNWIQGKYVLPKKKQQNWNQQSWGNAWKKLQDPMNQAYVESLITYAFSLLREQDVSPHFHHFYGAFRSIADIYAYNITDSYMSYRHCRWFWDNQLTDVFHLGFDDDTPDEVKEAVLEQPDELYETDEGSDYTSDESDNSEESIEELDGIDIKAENASMHSESGSAIELVSDNEGSEEDEDDDDDDDEDEEDELNIFAEINNFPVMMIYTESSEGTMDDLLDNYDEVGAKPGSLEWDRIWSAWIFQVIAALSVAQSIFAFTHNDLHSNNIVWTKTNKEFLYYTTRDGTLFKIPTFGKIFRLIDFGRSIYKINENFFYSDDFRPGNDAAEQYNFGDFEDKKEKYVAPNPSFDLARFTISVFESIFPTSPERRENGAVLSKEPGLEIIETESDLYNLLWSWLICKDGHNILMEPDGKERYPDFELYKVIAAEIHSAIPSEQIRKPVFEQFRIDTSPQNEKVYSLFC